MVTVYLGVELGAQQSGLEASNSHHNTTLKPDFITFENMKEGILMVKLTASENQLRMKNI